MAIMGPAGFTAPERLPPSAAIPATAEEGFLRAHALRLVPGTEAGVEVVVWCGDVAFPILRPEAWQKIFAYDCATSHWPAEFPGCPPPAPHESPRAFGRRVLPVAREVLPELARRDGARGVTEAQWLRCAGDWLRAVWDAGPRQSCWSPPMWSSRSATDTPYVNGTPRPQRSPGGGPFPSGGPIQTRS